MGDGEALPCDRTQCCTGGAGTGTKVPAAIWFKCETSSTSKNFLKDWISVRLVWVTQNSW